MNNKSVYTTLFMLMGSLGSFVLFSLYFNFTGFISYFGLPDGNKGDLLSWGLALIIVVAYSASAAKISDVKLYMFKLDTLKVVAVLAAIFAGITEEIIFRKWVMDYLESKEYGAIVQVAISGLVFGLAHLIWGFKNISAGVNAVLSTSILGGALAIVYLLGDRSLLPCIVAHFFITALIEPGLIIAAVNDKIGYLSEKN